ncbi:polyketide synthase dehydratase domain-containing protein, partial [Pelosinus fermentans]
QADINRYKEILHALADLYCQGYDLAWRQLYGEEKPNRLHLPGYPFAKESYWVPEMESSLTDRSHLGNVTVLHPLLQQNTSDFSEQRFSSSFTGEEFFLKDHVVKGQRILPGVAYLEMVRAAAQQTAGALMEEKTGMRLKDIIWAQPIVVGEEAAQVHIGLFPKENGEISYEIYSQMKDNVKEAVIHNQGSIALVSYLEERKVLDLKALQAECSQGTLSAAQCYKRLKAAGMECDTRYQGIESVYLGVDQVLAKLMIPSSILDTQEQFNLHPCLLDSVMQVIGLQMAAECCRPAAIIALQELAIIGQCISAPWVRICRDRKSERFDVDFCDDQGMVYMQMKGLEIQAYTEEMNMIPSETNSPYPEIHNSQYPVAQGRRAEMKGFTLEQCIDWDLKEQVSQLLKIPRDKLDREENLAEFGFDSISLSEFAGIITDHYSIEFTPALFFGYSTLKSLTQYFLTEYQDVMQLHYREAVMEEGRQVVQAVPAATLTSKRQASTQSRFIKKPASQQIQEQEPIAIIGMSGRFPEARTV